MLASKQKLPPSGIRFGWTPAQRGVLSDRADTVSEPCPGNGVDRRTGGTGDNVTKLPNCPNGRGHASLTIELRHLRYVIAAAENRSFRRAAMVLGVRESAISRRIRDLEDEIGAALFIRHHGGVNLTYAGKKFLGRARKAISQIGYAAKDIAAAGRGEEGLVRIGIFSSLASGFLAELLIAYDAEHSGVRLDFIEASPSEHVAAIQQHRLDVAFLTGQPCPEGCDVAHLWNERIFVALPQHDELAEQDGVTWKDLRNRHFIVSEVEPGPEVHDYLIKHLAEFGHHPSVERCGVGRDNLMQLVALHRGLTLTSEAMTAVQFIGTVYRPLIGECLPFSAVWSPKNDNPALRRLLSMARSMSKRHFKKTAFTQPPIPPPGQNVTPAVPSQTPDPSP